MDSFVEVERTGCLGRLRDSIFGALIGFLLFVLAFPLLFWNEGRAVRRYEDLEHGRGAVVSVSSKKVDAKKNGKLVHVSGDAKPKGKPQDATFGVSADAIRIDRDVEMYQWKETSKSTTKKKVGGGEEKRTEYSYSKEWSSSLISSSGFKKKAGHTNPSSMPFESKSFTADKVTLGAFKLGKTMKGKMNKTEPLELNSKTLKKKKGGDIESGYLFIGDSYSSPDVGDVRISWALVKPAEITVVGKQKDGTLIPYSDKEMNDDIALLEYGSLTADQMFQEAEDDNWVLTWVLRIVGLLVMFGGLRLIAKPLSTMGDVIPFVGTAIGYVTGFVALLIALAFSSVTVAIAWLFYRPLLAIGLLVLGALAIGGSIALIKMAKD